MTEYISIQTYANTHVGPQKYRYVKVVAMLVHKRNNTVSEQLVGGICSAAAVNMAGLTSPTQFSPSLVTINVPTAPPWGGLGSLTLTTAQQRSIKI